MRETLRHINTAFKGFVSNRFGRIAELSKMFILHKDSIKSFFEEVVDANSNNLVLAVSTYIQNDWFIQCSDLYAEFGEIIIFPLMAFLGIDSHKKTKSKARNWDGVKEFFNQKVSELIDLRAGILESHPNGIEKLKAAILEEVVDTIERQCNQVSYLRNDETLDKENKQLLKQAPLTLRL